MAVSEADVEAVKDVAPASFPLGPDLLGFLLQLQVSLAGAFAAVWQGFRTIRLIR